MSASKPSRHRIPSAVFQGHCCNLGREVPASLILLFGLLCLIPGCHSVPAILQISDDGASVTGRSVVVEPGMEWTSTGVKPVAGQILQVRARGRIRLVEAPETDVSPDGTYLLPDQLMSSQFPLPAGIHGPAPAFGLIGRIGTGLPFPIGRLSSVVADQSGELELRINQPEQLHATGNFTAQVSEVASEHPVWVEELPGSAAAPPPTSDVPTNRSRVNRIFVFYMDGLRPDVVREMAAMGHLPHIRRHFIERGTWLENATTVFPSDTITANATMWTGCFSDRHGIKGQVRFSRRTLDSQSGLSPLGPLHSARNLHARDFDQLVHWVRARPDLSQTTGASTEGQPILAEILQRNGKAFQSGILPLMTTPPHPLWTRSFARVSPYWSAHEAWKYVDDANVHFTIHELLDREAGVTVVWLPETDSISHRGSRGQFGATRRTIAQADALIGQIFLELQRRDQIQESVFMLVSDHGHHGGERRHLDHLDLANEVLFAPREISPDGQWTSGGLGISVRRHRRWNRHPGDATQAFAFVDGEGDGTARIFLPFAAVDSGDWRTPNKVEQLTNYRIASNHPPVNLLRKLASVQKLNGRGQAAFPIDLVLARITPQSILITTRDRGTATVERQRRSGQWVYRYRIARSGHQSHQDPLGYLESFSADELGEWCDGSEWLRRSFRTPYPDSVVALSHHMLWSEQRAAEQREFACDVVVTAQDGWYFGTKQTRGTAHGYPNRDSMRACWFIAGPGIRRASRIRCPVRLADLTPTLLGLLGKKIPADEFDGRDISDWLLEPIDGRPASPPRHVVWSDLDLGAWKPVEFRPRPESEYEPNSINRPEHPADVHNLVYNLIGLTNLNPLRLVNDVLNGTGFLETEVLGKVETFDREISGWESAWWAAPVEALEISQISLSDYSPTSGGNLHRVNNALQLVETGLGETAGRVGGLVGADPGPIGATVKRPMQHLRRIGMGMYNEVRFLAMYAIDEQLLNRVEDGWDFLWNNPRTIPSELSRPESSVTNQHN